MIQLQLLILNTLLFISCSAAETHPITQDQQADVTQVKVSGSENGYTFSITISSPDTGCDQYANWWEVVTESGELIYRRILLHSHTGEQPFTRSGGTIAITKEQVVWVRAHMNNSGYGGSVMKGSVQDGFSVEKMPSGFASELDQVAPLPNGCNF